MPAKRRKIEKGPVELIEEAAHLLRMAPAGALAAYYAGTIPFALAFLYFWADMSRSAFAYDHCATSALGLGLLYLWMKAWQAAAAARWLGFVKGLAAPRWTLRKTLRMTLTQAAIQPSSLFILPASFVIVLPFGWTWAFYQNTTVLGESESMRECLAESSRLSNLEQGRNHVLIFTLLLFGIVCYFNLLTFAVLVPELLRMFLGIESVFTQTGPNWIFNSTALSAIFALTWLCVDPLVKAVYVLRCFYCQSLRTGEDLAADLRGLPASGGGLARGLGIALVAAFLALSASAQSNEPRPAPARPPVSAPAAAPPAVSSTELDRSISTTLEKREFAWRLPRQKAPEDDSNLGWIARSVISVLRTLDQWRREVFKFLGKVRDWLRQAFPDRSSPDTGSGGTGTGWMTSLRFFFIALILIIAAILGVMIVRALRNRRGATTAVQAQAAPPPPNLEDENLAATQLPEDEWLKMARELAGQGNLRVALRAYYLASLAHLDRRELIAVARYKSNRDYEREARRRGRALPDLTGAFSENIAVFDRSWYGLREVTSDILERFRQNTVRICAC